RAAGSSVRDFREAPASSLRSPPHIVTKPKPNGPSEATTILTQGEQICLSRCDRAFVSIYGDERLPSNQRTIANARTFLAQPGLTLDFFSAESAPVWQIP
ncbi:hypothetical protein, partial [Geomonas sp. Red276]